MESVGFFIFVVAIIYVIFWSLLKDDYGKSDDAGDAAKGQDFWRPGKPQNPTPKDRVK